MVENRTPPTTTTTTEPLVASGDECLIGTWVTDNEAWGEAFSQMIPPNTPMELDSITGTVQVEFAADGTVVTTYDEWTISASLLDPPGESTIVRDGVDTGTYTTGDDGSFSMAEVESNSTVEATATVGGQTMAMPPVEGMQTDVITGAGTFECEGDRLGVEVEGATVWMDRAG